MKNIYLQSGFPISDQAILLGIQDFDGLIQFIQQLPYGRTKDRSKPEQVLEELKGTCSTKHALIKKIAMEQGNDTLKLIIGLYKMNHLNTPGIGNVLLEKGLEYIPEAHCYLSWNGKRMDITNPNASIESIKNAIMEEQEIVPEQIGDFKVNYHKTFLQSWKKEQAVPYSFDEIWEIREQCILNLSK